MTNSATFFSFFELEQEMVGGFFLSSFIKQKKCWDYHNTSFALLIAFFTWLKPVPPKLFRLSTTVLGSRTL